MSFPAAQGQPQWSGHYIPTLYSSKLMVAFVAACCLAAISNTDYEGEIKNKGDKVIVPIHPETLIYDYEKGQGLQAQDYTPDSIELNIDKGKYWQRSINLVDSVQTHVYKANNWALDAADQLKVAIETDVFSVVYGQCHAQNVGNTAGEDGDIALGAASSPVGISKSSFIDKLIDCKTVLTQQNVPEENRFIVLPPAIVAKLLGSDLKDASLTGDGLSILRNGWTGKKIAGFNIFESNLLAKTTESAGVSYNCLFGHKSGITFATQTVITETLKNPNDFGDLMRGLQVYGYKVIRSESLGNLYAYAA